MRTPPLIRTLCMVPATRCIMSYMYMYLVEMFPWNEYTSFDCVHLRACPKDVHCGMILYTTCTVLLIKRVIFSEWKHEYANCDGEWTRACVCKRECVRERESVYERESVCVCVYTLCRMCVSVCPCRAYRPQSLYVSPWCVCVCVWVWVSAQSMLHYITLAIFSQC